MLTVYMAVLLSERYLAIESAPDSDSGSGIVDEFDMMRLKKILAHGRQPNVTARRPLYCAIPGPIGAYLDAGKRADVSHLKVYADRPGKIETVLDKRLVLRT